MTTSNISSSKGRSRASATLNSTLSATLSLFALSLDREDACGGYTSDNIRVIPIEENVAKGNRERHLPEHVRAVMARREPDCPF